MQKDLILCESLEPCTELSLAPGTDNSQLLVVDDQSFNIMAIELQLSIIGISCAKAGCGEQALELFDQRLRDVAAGTRGMFKLILLSYDMEGLSGPQTAEQIKKKFAGFRAKMPEVACQMPVLVFLTSLNRKEIRDHRKASRGDNFALKPMSLVDLKTLL